MDGFLSEILGGAKDFFLAKEQSRQVEASTRLAVEASSQAVELRGQQVKALVIAAVAGLGLVLLLRQSRRG